MGAQEFLREFGSRFLNREIATWAWGAEEEDFGLRASWLVTSSVAGVREVRASVELQSTQCVLGVSVRDTDVGDGGADPRAVSTQVVFEATLFLEEGRVVIAGEECGLSRESIDAAIEQFNGWAS